MNDYHYIGFDVHKAKIYYCVKTADGTVVEKGKFDNQREAVRAFAQRQKEPWKGVLEATLFSGWIWDELVQSAAEMQMAHPLMVKAIQAAKHKSDKLDTDKLCDLVRCNWVPQCYVPPPQIRHLRRMLRWREKVKRHAVQTKNRIGTTLMEVGVSYCRAKLHGKKYFHTLLDGLKDVPAEVRLVLRHNRALLEMFQSTQRQILKQLQNHPQLQERVKLLRTIPAIGLITALTWALEGGQPERFSSIRKAVSYSGLVSGQDQSGEQQRSGPLSKQRNPYLQAALIEAAKLSPRLHPHWAEFYARKIAQGATPNQATIAIARKMVAYLLAVDRSRKPFQLPNKVDSSVSESAAGA